MANVAVQAYLMRAGAHMGGLPGRRASIVGIFRFVFYNQVSRCSTVTLSFRAFEFLAPAAALCRTDGRRIFLGRYASVVW